MAQESKSVGMSLRNTADRQSRAVSQAAPRKIMKKLKKLKNLNFNMHVKKF